MSRSGYSEDCDNDWGLIRYRGMVASATRGKRGQKLLRDLAEALDAMPVKRLVTGALQLSEGEVCALGCLGAARGIDMEKIDPEDAETVAATFDIATPLAREIEWENDEAAYFETPEGRWRRMRAWVRANLKDDA